MTFEELRAKLEPHFSAETSNDSTNYKGGSHGHCAVVAYIVNRLFGGAFVSTKVYLSNEDKEVSHWFNRVSIGGIEIDVDLTADQFGWNNLSFAFKDQLWSFCTSMMTYGMSCTDNKVRNRSELNEETIKRAELLLKKANIPIQPVIVRVINV